MPNPYPPASAWDGTNWADGTWQKSCWVGIDGDLGVQELLQAGTAQVVTMSGGRIASQTVFAEIEWWTANPVRIPNFVVKPGDIVSLSVCSLSSDTFCSIWLLNESSNKYTTTSINAPARKRLQGTTAEWITEDSGNSPVPFPNYGAVFFVDCMATSKTMERDVSNANSYDIVLGGRPCPRRRLRMLMC